MCTFLASVIHPTATGEKLVRIEFLLATYIPFTTKVLPKGMSMQKCLSIGLGNCGYIHTLTLQTLAAKTTPFTIGSKNYNPRKMKTYKFFLFLAVVILISSCRREDKGRRSAMVLDTLTDSKDVVFIESTDSIPLAEPLFYDSSKTMLLDSEPLIRDQIFNEKMPLPEEPKK